MEQYPSTTRWGSSFFHKKKQQPALEAIPAHAKAPPRLPKRQRSIDSQEFALIPKFERKLKTKVTPAPVSETSSLPEGQLRFEPQGIRSTEEQIDSLTESERECFNRLKQKWEEKHPPFSDEMYLRFARCSPGTRQFNPKAAFKVLKKFDQRYLKLKAVDLERQLATKTLFPVPGLKTRDGHDMFYMRPSRYCVRDTPASDIIDNLAYVMSTMMEKEEACSEGIGFLANMNDWTMKNFDVNYCYQFMMMLQGTRVPVRVKLFLIVNPPLWFDEIWKIMRTMLSKEFRRKVYCIKEEDLLEHLRHGTEEFLPDETELGQANTEELVQDFISYRKYVEG